MPSRCLAPCLELQSESDMILNQNKLMIPLQEPHIVPGPAPSLWIPVATFTKRILAITTSIDSIQKTDCYLRQGAGGMKLHDWGRELAFLDDFMSVLKRISARNLKNIVIPSKNVVWRSKTIIFWEKWVTQKCMCSKTDFLIKCLDVSAWFYMEKLKNTVLRAKNTEQYKKYTF